MNNTTRTENQQDKEYLVKVQFYRNLSDSIYLGWVSAYQRGTLTRGQVKNRVQGWIRKFGTNKNHPTASYKEWVRWMHKNHDNSFDHIL